MRIVSSWRTTCTTKSSRERSVYPIAPSRASSSTVASTKRKNGSKKTSQASWKFASCLRRLMAAFSESHTKVCPRSSSPVSTNYSVYTLHVRVKRLTYSCARRGTCDGADIAGLGSAVSAARLHSRRVEGAPRQKYVLLSSRGHFPKPERTAVATSDLRTVISYRQRDTLVRSARRSYPQWR
jgi:hypothetical protein